MKYEVRCPVCGTAYEVNMDFTPGFCLKCGSVVEVTEVKTSARVAAEARMRDLDELAPRIDKAYEAYLELTTEWYDTFARLRYYKNRNVITEEEFEKYRRQNGKSSKSQTQRIKEYRKKKREAEV